MAKAEVYTCDVCGVQKKESNHWWIAQVGLGRDGHFRLAPWSPNFFENEIHLCGHACVIQKVSEFMGKADPEPICGMGDHCGHCPKCLSLPNPEPGKRDAIRQRGGIVPIHAYLELFTEAKAVLLNRRDVDFRRLRAAVEACEIPNEKGEVKP